jgi:ADP-ribose pyrophosphatase YjhB (NUDIX family)
MSEKKVGVGFGVMILDKDGRILLGRRHEDPEKADSELKGEGTWTMPGGKMEFQEGIEEGATREVMEETSIAIKDPQVFCVNNDMVDSAHFVTIGILVKDFEGEAKVMEPDEITEWKWFETDNLPHPIFFPSARVLENYKQGKFYIRR